jgi:hypothetical protein
MSVFDLLTIMASSLSTFALGALIGRKYVNSV